jgi:hypothetical protein
MKRKPPSIPKLKKKALDLYAELEKLRAYVKGELRCYTCDSHLVLNTINTQLGHFLPRGAYPGLTFHPENSKIQCYRCNCKLHGNLFEFRERLIAERGIEKVEKLESMRHVSLKLGRSDYEGMIKEFSAEIKEIKDSM